MKKKRVLCNISDLGFDLYDERTKRNWSQRQVAKMLEVSYQSYQNWESGITKSITPTNFNRLKDLYLVEAEAV